MMILVLAALLPSATWAQNKPQVGQGAEPGARYCGHVMDAGTFVDARARNASGEQALVIRWLDQKTNTVHSGLFMGRCVAKDGDKMIDGKIIARILASSLAVSEKHALTGWEADYWNHAGEQTGGGTPHRGVFNENRFVAELDASKASDPNSASSADPDFRWDEEQETLTLKPGILPPPPPTVNYTYRTAPPPSAPSEPAQAPAPAAKPNCTPQQGPKVNVQVSKKASTWACVHLGICPDDKPVVLNRDNGCPGPPAPGQQAK